MHQILYLVRAKQYLAAVAAYRKQAHEKHSLELLEQMACIILEQGAYDPDPEVGLLSMFGSGIGGIPFSLALLQRGLNSKSPSVQMAALQFLAHIQEDSVDNLLQKATLSEDFFVRMEAAYYLCARKSKTALGRLESLMHKTPEQVHYFFPELCALIDSPDATHLLRRLFQNKNPHVRISAILSASYHGRDDLTPYVRTALSHNHPAEQEACAMALGTLKDFNAIPKLIKLVSSGSSNVKLAAAYSLYKLGKREMKSVLIEMAEQENPFAITLLAKVEDAQEVLAKLTTSTNLTTRINSAIALLQHKDTRALVPLLEIFIRTSRDLALQPHFSTGQALTAWKVIPSATQHMHMVHMDLYSFTLRQREKLLSQCLELPEENFLELALVLLNKPQTDLIPHLIGLLENLQTPKALDLLVQKSQVLGQPLVRAYCHLALFRLKHKGPHLQVLHNWLLHQKDKEIIHFRGALPWASPVQDKTPSEMTPEETGRLFIEICQAYAENHEPDTIDTLLEMISTGHPRNRYVLAGLLIQAIQ